MLPALLAALEVLLSPPHLHTQLRLVKLPAHCATLGCNMMDVALLYNKDPRSNSVAFEEVLKVKTDSSTESRNRWCNLGFGTLRQSQPSVMVLSNPALRQVGG